MIFLDVCAVVIVVIAYGIYREVKATANRQRALYKTEGLHRFK